MSRMTDRQTAMAHYFGERLIERRHELGMTRQALADKADISLTNVRNYEKGYVQPTAYPIYALANVLGVTTDWLLGMRGAHDGK